MLLSTGFRKLHVYFVRKLNKNISISVQNSILEYYVNVVKTVCTSTISNVYRYKYTDIH